MSDQYAGPGGGPQDRPEGRPEDRSEDRIDLRPRGVGEILDAAQRLYRSNWKTLIAIVAIVEVPFWFIGLGINFAAPSLAETNPSTGAVEFDSSVLVSVLVFAGIGAVVGIIAQTLESAAVARATADIYLDREPTVGGSYRRALSRLGTLLVIALLTGLAVLGGFVLLVIPGIFLYLRFFAGTIVAVVERDEQSATDCMRRSWRLVKGRTWPVLGTLVLAFLIVAIGSLVISLPFQVLGTAGASVGNLIGTLLLAPYAAVVYVVLYFDLRIRKEGFDLELMARELSAPGAPGAGGAHSGPGQGYPGQTGPGQTGPGQTGPGQTGPGQTGPGQTGPGTYGDDGTGRSDGGF